MLSWQGAAADSEAKSEELSRAVEELHKLLKDAGEGARLLQNDHNHHSYVVLDLLLEKESLNSESGFDLPWQLLCLLFPANKALEEKLQEMNGVTDKSVAELKERIQSLEKELENANELLSSCKLRGLLDCFAFIN